MNKPPLPDEEDLAFFKEAMSDVKRTESFSIKASKKNNGKLGKAELINFKEKNKQHPILFDPTELTISSEDHLFFERPGLQNKRIKQFVRGTIASSNCLDLHEMTVEQARNAVLNFLFYSRERNYACVRIIHGKGRLSLSGAKLKNCVNCWLMQIPWVLAFSSARPRDGGAGALYVLLRRNRNLH